VTLNGNSEYRGQMPTGGLTTQVCYMWSILTE